MAASTLSPHKFVSEDWPSWTQWGEDWRKADNISTCLGLLHTGFQTKVFAADELSERLCFYLKLADAQWTSTPISNGNSAMKRKAIKVLADLDTALNDVFGKGLLAMTPETARQMFKFFRPKDGTEGGGLASFETPKAGRDFELHDHAAKKLNERLLEWCTWVWRKEYAYVSRHESGGRWPKNPLTIAILDEKRVDILDILHAYGNGKLESLLDIASVLDDSDPDDLKCVFRVRWELFTPECVQRLYQLASRKSGLTGPHTLDEAAQAALVAGSSAAKVLTLVQTAQAKLTKG